ncbi:hypothetical protein GCM10027081_01090 [Cupriavidus yeoncheonensis]
MVRESCEPGNTVSMVARQHCVIPNQRFQWRKLYQDGSLSAVSAGEEVVPASELSDALKQMRELQWLLGKKTTENEILREAVEVMKSRKWIARTNTGRKSAVAVLHHTVDVRRTPGAIPVFGIAPMKGRLCPPKAPHGAPRSEDDPTVRDRRARSSGGFRRTPRLWACGLRDSSAAAAPALALAAP